MRRAFTLIEVIAVVVVLSLGAGVLAVSAAQSASDATDRAAIAAWLQLDTTARAAARRQGPAVLAVSDGGHAFELRRADGSQVSAHLAGLWARIDPAGAITIDARGRSRDYAVTFYEPSGRMIATYDVLGATGQVVRSDS